MATGPPPPMTNAPSNIQGNAPNTAQGGGQPLHSPPLPTTDEEKQEYAWQYYGYPALSEWMASSHDFFIIRRYSRESARCLLRLQHDIAKVSKAIDNIDAFLQSQPAGTSSCDSFDDDVSPERLKHIETMENLLRRYYNLVNSFTQVRKNPTARDHHVRNLESWLVTYPGAVNPKEQHFRDPAKRSDLFPIIFRERSPLRLFIGEIKWLRYVFKPHNTAGRFESSATWYTSETALDWLTIAIILVVGLCLLFGPMWALHFVGDNTKRLGIITGFVSAFTGLTFSAAGQRPFEILAATAAYAAVLMVYLQNSDE